MTRPAHLRLAVALLGAAGLGACVCVPADSDAARRGHATFAEANAELLAAWGASADCPELDGPVDARETAWNCGMQVTGFPATDGLWSRTIYSVSSPGEDSPGDGGSPGE